MREPPNAASFDVECGPTACLRALFLVLWGSVVVGSVDNVLRPLVVGAREKQHPVLIALAAIGGTYAFGPLGILLGPLLVSLGAALLKEIQKLTSPSAVAAEYPADEQAAPAGTSGHVTICWKVAPGRP